MHPLDSQSAAQHQHIKLLLPWYINQSLDLQEQQQVEMHLQQCLLCSCELAELQSLAFLIKKSAENQLTPTASFADLQAKIQNRKHAQQAAYQTNAVKRGKLMRWATGFLNPTLRRSGNAHYWAVAASIVVALLPAIYFAWQLPAINTFHTLASNEAVLATPNRLHVVFTQSISDTDIDALLLPIHAHRLDGPNSVGMYTLLVDNKDDSQTLDKAVSYLRNQSIVMLAEPTSQP
ncbi:hypothetical protein [Methylomonas sp. AM2-LC]|uniref:hypothetical protein n=1 Tax=Methylomonas sp. AM2-LC TaxID=3153301 RepID=UPI003266D079